jgi:cytochrome b6-f complex iron-sulfur subunit
MAGRLGRLHHGQAFSYPRPRKEVPVVNEVSSMGRRRFLNWFLGTTLGALLVSILYPVLRFVSPPRIPESTAAEVEAGLANDPELIEKGFKIVRFGAEPVIVVRVSDTDFRAFAATCTHLDCIVEYRKDKQNIWCNCHNGAYDLTGRNIAGPPPRPLAAYRVHLVSKGSGQPAALVVGKA